MTRTPWPDGTAGTASYRRSWSFPPAEGIVTGPALRSRGSSGLTVIGLAPAVVDAGGVANGTRGCGDGGFTVALALAAAPPDAARGWSTVPPRAESTRHAAPAPP